MQGWETLRHKKKSIFKLQKCDSCHIIHRTINQIHVKLDVIIMRCVSGLTYWQISGYLGQRCPLTAFHLSLCLGLCSFHRLVWYVDTESCHLMLFWSIIVFTSLANKGRWETHSTDGLLVWVRLQGAWRWCRKTNVIFSCTNLVVNTGLKVAFEQLPFGVHVCESL